MPHIIVRSNYLLYGVDLYCSRYDGKYFANLAIRPEHVGQPVLLAFQFPKAATQRKLILASCVGAGIDSI